MKKLWSNLVAVLSISLLVACSAGRHVTEFPAPQVSDVVPDALSSSGGIVEVHGSGFFEWIEGAEFPSQLGVSVCGVELTGVSVAGDSERVVLPSGDVARVRSGSSLLGVLPEIDAREFSGSSLIVSLPDGQKVEVKDAVDCFDPTPVISSVKVEGEAQAGESTVFFFAVHSPVGESLSCVFDAGDGSDPVQVAGCAEMEHVYEEDGAFTAVLSVEDESGRKVSEDVPVSVRNAAPSAHDDEVSVSVLDLPIEVKAATLLANDFGVGLEITGVEPSSLVSLDAQEQVVVFDLEGDHSHLRDGEAITEEFSYTVTAGNGLSDSAVVKVSVTGKDSVAGVSVPEGDQEIEVDETASLTAEVETTGGASAGVSWYSSDDGIAEVVEGEVTGVAPGTVTITAVSDFDASHSASVQVAVAEKDEVLGVSIAGDCSMLLVDGECELTATVDRSGDADEGVIWESDDTGVVSVADGVLKGISTGKVTVKAVSEADPAVFAEVIIMVVLPMEITVDTTETGSRAVELEIFGEGELNIDWGDGTDDEAITITNATAPSHTYDADGRYVIVVSGKLTGSENRFKGLSDNRALIEVSSWGDLNFTHLESAFSGAINLTAVPDYLPENTIDTSFMFFSAKKFNGSISAWDVSGVRDMVSMFSGAAAFNQDLDGWGDTTSNVEIMHNMFYGAESFDGSISAWDVSGVRDMVSMFSGAAAFNQDLDGWGDTTSNVETMRSMFYGAKNFDGSIGAWDVSSVTDMRNMFNGATSFSQNLSEWDVRNVMSCPGFSADSKMDGADIPEFDGNCG